MSLSTVLEFNKPDKMKTNNILLEIARKVVNSSPEPRYKIKIRDEVLAMKEKERLGFNFNRSVTASLKSRWDVVENATKDYLQEIFEMNDQIEEDGRKYENQLINLIVTRTTNLGLNSRIEQMAGLFMHMNFYCTVLKFKIQHLEPARAFMFNCSDLLGFSRPSQLVDRYAALQHVFTELYIDYEARQNLLNHLTETLSEVKAETNHRNMLMHNQMAEMHSRIKHLQTESAQLERAIIDQMESSTGASLEIYKIKNAVYNIYITMMSYRGLEATHSDSFGQLEELEVRVSHTQAAVKMLQMEEAKRQSKKKIHKKADRTDAHYEGDAFSDNISEHDSDTRSHRSGVEGRVSFHENANASANESSSNTGGLYVSAARRMLKKSNAVKSRTLPPDAGLMMQRRVPLPPIVAKESVSANHKETFLPQGNLLLPKLDTSSNKTAVLQQNLKMKPESVIGRTDTGRSAVQESGRSTGSVRQLSFKSCNSEIRTRPGKISDGVSYRQSSVGKDLAKNNRAIGRSAVNKIHPQNKFKTQTSEVSSELKSEMEFDEKETDESSIFLTGIPECESTSVLYTIDENTDENVNATKERKSRSRSSTVQTKNAKPICCTNLQSRSNSLAERRAKKVRSLKEIASRQSLKNNGLNILAKVEPSCVQEL